MTTKATSRRPRTKAAHKPATPPKRRPRKAPAPNRSEIWDLRLYVAGQSAKSAMAIANLTRLCEEHLAGKYRIEIIDLVKQPQLARGDQILAIPTLIRKLPSPIKRIIGDLSNADRALIGLDLRPAE